MAVHQIVIQWRIAQDGVKLPNPVLCSQKPRGRSLTACAKTCLIPFYSKTVAWVLPDCPYPHLKSPMVAVSKYITTLSSVPVSVRHLTWLLPFDWLNDDQLSGKLPAILKTDEGIPISYGIIYFSLPHRHFGILRKCSKLTTAIRIIALGYTNLSSH